MTGVCGQRPDPRLVIRQLGRETVVPRGVCCGEGRFHPEPEMRWAALGRKGGRAEEAPGALTGPPGL